MTPGVIPGFATGTAVLSANDQGVFDDGLGKLTSYTMDSFLCVAEIGGKARASRSFRPRPEGVKGGKTLSNGRGGHDAQAARHILAPGRTELDVCQDLAAPRVRRILCTKSRYVRLAVFFNDW